MGDIIEEKITRVDAARVISLFQEAQHFMGEPSEPRYSTKPSLNFFLPVMRGNTKIS